MEETLRPPATRETAEVDPETAVVIVTARGVHVQVEGLAAKKEAGRPRGQHAHDDGEAA